jgi:hypothetical protein
MSALLSPNYRIRHQNAPGLWHVGPTGRREDSHQLFQLAELHASIKQSANLSKIKHQKHPSGCDMSTSGSDAPKALAGRWQAQAVPRWCVRVAGATHRLGAFLEDGLHRHDVPEVGCERRVMVGKVPLPRRAALSSQQAVRGMPANQHQDQST